MTQHFTSADIPDQSGKTAVVTGGNSGIGYCAALELARKGASVIIACRDVAKGGEAQSRIQREVSGADVSVEALDLASQASVHDFARNFLGTGRPLHLLINNAGVMALPKRTETMDGYEMQFGTNVLGHFALTGLLLPAMAATAPNISAGSVRVVTLASIAHMQGRITLDDLQQEKNYSPWGAYRQSKLADLMIALELDRRLRDCGSPVMSVAAHPGIANTNLFVRDVPSWQRPFRIMAGSIIALFLNTSAQGALPTLFAATSPNAKPGGYYGPTGLREMRGPVGAAKISNRAQNRTMAAELWQACERMTGVKMP
jgi:NAD(P)-dependent dehydrogenase (short-subunit alcohol dehydrogenase family)